MIYHEEQLLGLLEKRIFCVQIFEGWEERTQRRVHGRGSGPVLGFSRPGELRSRLKP